MNNLQKVADGILDNSAAEHRVENLRSVDSVLDYAEGASIPLTRDEAQRVLDVARAWVTALDHDLPDDAWHDVVLRPLADEDEDDEPGVDYDIPSGRLGYADRTIGDVRVSVLFTPSLERDCDRPRVTIWQNVGSGTPMEVYHGRAVLIGSINNRDGEDVERILREREDDLLALDRLYLGSEWDGSNRRGRWQRHEQTEQWDEGAEDRLQHALSDALSDAKTYWDADDWFSPAESCVLAELIVHLDNGGTVESAAENACDEASRESVLLDEAQVAEWLADTAIREKLCVEIETMPEEHRASHRAAGNWGQYPHNGAVRTVVSAARAHELVEGDPEGYARVVRGELEEDEA